MTNVVAALKKKPSVLSIRSDDAKTIYGYELRDKGHSS